MDYLKIFSKEVVLSCIPFIVLYAIILIIAIQLHKKDLKQKLNIKNKNMEKELNYISERIAEIDGMLDLMESDNEKDYCANDIRDFYEEKEILENILNKLTLIELG